MRIFFPSPSIHTRLINEIFPFSFSSLSKDISRGDFLFSSCSENFAFQYSSPLYSLTIQHASFGNEHTSSANIVFPSFFPLESKDPVVYVDPFGFSYEVSNIITIPFLSFSNHNSKNFFPIKSNHDIFNYLYTFLFSESLEKHHTFTSNLSIGLIKKPFVNNFKPKFFSSTLKFLVFRADLPFISHKVFFFFLLFFFFL